MPPSTTFVPPVPFNIADYFLDDRIREGLGSRIALRTREGNICYAELQARANRFANAFAGAGVEPEQRVIVALPDSADFAAALFGALKCGAVAVMANPRLPVAKLRELFDYARAKAAVVHADQAAPFRKAAGQARHAPVLHALGTQAGDEAVAAQSPAFANFPSHPADAALWLFSGGTTGRPKGVVQSHASFANTTERYAKEWMGWSSDDITLSVPKLYFGYATGSNLFFPMAVGGSAVLFPERCTAGRIFRQIARHQPTILVTVPTMVNQMVSHPEAAAQDLTCLRLATSAGEPLPVALHRRWDELFGVELLDGLGTAEMWHIFISNRPGRVREGTLGQAVPGFEVSLRNALGEEARPGETGRMRVKGGSLGNGYWQLPRETRRAFAGKWYVSADMMTRDDDGCFTYRGRADDLLKVAGKWLSPTEVEDCLLGCPVVREAAVVGTETPDGLVVPVAFVTLGNGGSEEVAEQPDASQRGSEPDAEAAIRRHLARHLQPYKHPRQITFLDELPRTHLGKTDRGALKLRTTARPNPNPSPKPADAAGHGPKGAKP